MTRALRSLVDALEHDPSLLKPSRLRQRIEALDQLEEGLLDASYRQDDRLLRRRAEAIHAKLEGINRAIYTEIRHDIQRGVGAKTLRKWLPAESPPEGARGEGYDYLDALLSGVLPFEEPREEIAELAPDMVFYQPTPARHIFELIDRLSLSERDVLIDLGSGLGHVPLLTAICTKAQCIGIELESAYVDGAQHCAQALNLGNASFLRQDARMADLSRGTVFYLYTPFTGSLMRHVLDRLKQQASERDIRIGTLGPCTSVLAGESWLNAVGMPHRDRITLFSSA